MKILVIGLGSMGKRRIRLIQAFTTGHDIVGVDSSFSRREESENLFGIKTYESLSVAIEEFSPEAAFVSTPPLTHHTIITTLLENSIHVFSEINLVSLGYSRNISLAKERNLVLFLSSTPMYRKEIEYITNKVKENGKVAYRYHVGQYLPDWHPWENYKDFFVGDKRTSGLRELFGIEFPWIVNAFDEIVSFTTKSTKLTELKIDYDDCFVLTVEHKNGTIGQLTFDVVCRKAIRDLLVYSEDIYLRWEGTPSTLRIYNIEKKEDEYISCYDEVVQDSRYSSNIVENAYVAEIEDFLSQIENFGLKEPLHSFSKDKKIQDLIERVYKG